MTDPRHYGMHRHFTAAGSVLMFGGGVKKGFVYGRTAEERPCTTLENPVPVENLHATIFHALGIPADKVNGFAAIALNLYKAYVEEDATLAEINPLILTSDGNWLALDSKMSFDDNALFRHLLKSLFELLRLHGIA